MLYYFYTLLPSAFGKLAIVWQETEGRSKVHEIGLPKKRISREILKEMSFVDTHSIKSPAIKKLIKDIHYFLKGQAINFSLDIIALERCPNFQKRVLIAEHKIPRGWISTYGRIAKNLKIPGSARAVGQALAQNPFPIIIPCHRAIKSNGELGGFQGGLKMKKRLLELEGVKCSKNGKVITEKIFY